MYLHILGSICVPYKLVLMNAYHEFDLLYYTFKDADYNLQIIGVAWHFFRHSV